jgi:hypothetical protein
MCRFAVGSTILIAVTLLETYACPPAHSQSRPNIDYQKLADGAAWKWFESPWGPVAPVGKYTLQLTLAPNDPPLFSILDGRKEIFSWHGNQYSVYRVVDDRLYYIDFQFTQPGGTVVAVNLANGQELWRSPLKGLVGSSAARTNLTRFNLDVQPPVIAVTGWETGGRYFEIKDIINGETVGHKVFPPATLQSND